MLPTPEDHALASELRALGFEVVIDEWPPKYVMDRLMNDLHAHIAFARREDAIMCTNTTLCHTNEVRK